MSEFTVERDGNILKFIAHTPAQAAIQTAGQGEEPKVIELQGRFPLNLYNRLKRAADPTAYEYGTTPFRLPGEEELPSLMVVPVRWNDERFVQIHWHERPGSETTRFEIRLTASELDELIRCIEDGMTC